MYCILSVVLLISTVSLRSLPDLRKAYHITVENFKLEVKAITSGEVVGNLFEMGFGGYYNGGDTCIEALKRQSA